MHRAAEGRADLETGRPLEADDAFHLASLSKPFTALAVMLLAEEGKLGLEDRAREHVPGLPSWASPVTVADLLGHTSGIPDDYPSLDRSRLERLTNDGVITLLGQMHEPAFAPGTRFGHSNSNDVILSAIVEHASGESLGRFLSRRVFDPLGMASTVVYETEGQELPARAVGHARRDDGTFRVSDYLAVELPGGPVVPFRFTTTGGGGMLSTADDLLAWTRALFGGRILPRDGLDAALGGRRVDVPAADALGLRDCVYGNGWSICGRSGEELYWHDGNWGGFSTMLLHAPEQECTVIVLSNLAGGIAAELGLEIAGRLLDTGR